LRDPQRWKHERLSQALHILYSNAKGGLLLRGMVEGLDLRRIEESWADPAAITVVPPGVETVPKVPPPLPPAIASLMQYSDASLRDVSGVNLETMGQADRQQAGVVEYQRRQAAVTMLAYLFDGLRRYRKASGRVLLEMIREYISDGRLVRIAGDGRAA